MTAETSHPIAVIGAGPVGLAAAAHLARRGLPFLVLEAGPAAGHSVRQWGHVRLFSPWRYCLDGEARSLLLNTGWPAPDDDGLPSGDELVDAYLAPLASHPAIAPYLRLNARVTAIARRFADKAYSAGRERSPFELRLESGTSLLARAVIDASGTWRTPNPLGVNGLPVHGEDECVEHIAYGIPDVLGADRDRYQGKRVLVVGSGHSAINVVLDLLALREEHPATSVLWSLRRARVERLYGGESSDALPARGDWVHAPAGPSSRAASACWRPSASSVWNARTAPCALAESLPARSTPSRPMRSSWPPASGPTSTCCVSCGWRWVPRWNPRGP
jgi:hypothetical protein